MLFQVVAAIERRRLDFSTTSTAPIDGYNHDRGLETKATSSVAGKTTSQRETAVRNESTPPPRGPSGDKQRMELLRTINEFRLEYSVSVSIRLQLDS